MSRKKLKRVLAAVMVFYVFTAVLALFLLDGKSFFELRFGNISCGYEEITDPDFTSLCIVIHASSLFVIKLRFITHIEVKIKFKFRITT